MWAYFFLRLQFSMKYSHLKTNAPTQFAPQEKTKMFAVCASFKKHVFEAIFSNWKSGFEKDFFEKKSKFEAKFFPTNWSDFEMRIFHRCGIRKKIFFGYSFCGEKLFSQNYISSSYFIEKPAFDGKFTSQNKRLDSICSGKKTKFSLFVLILKGMILKQTFTIESEFEMKFFEKKRIRFWSYFFPLNGDFDMKSFHLVIFWI